MNMPLGQPHGQGFTQFARGVVGTFKVPTGTLHYLLTKARLGSNEIDPERRLTRYLIPVREVLEVTDLDFDELLQRDLDDQRVAAELIPYLFGVDTPLAFFPPVVAMLLPWDGHKIVNDIPDAMQVVELTEADGGEFSRRAFGSAYAVERLVTPDGLPSELPLGRLCWNDEHAKIVVLDGQHRAMALLAIERSTNDTWATTKGARYRPFYEKVIKEFGTAGGFGQLGEVELPVALCWLEEDRPAGLTPSQLARRLFLDVNKEARPPSEARLILLADDQLVHFFTRDVLSKFRSSESPLPIWCVEYDSADTRKLRPGRWSVVTNVLAIRDLVMYTVFPQPNQVTDVAARIAPAGARPWIQIDQEFRDRFRTSEMFNLEEVEGDQLINRNEIGNRVFLPKVREELRVRFRSSWGTAIVTLFGELQPFVSHRDALLDVLDEWESAGSSPGELAKSSLVEGTGLFTALYQAFTFWKEAAKHCADLGQAPPEKPPTVLAWDALEGRRVEFEKARSELLLGAPILEEEDRVETARVFDVITTRAFQIGLGLALVSVAEVAGWTVEDIADHVSQFVSILNEHLGTKTHAGRLRWCGFVRGSSYGVTTPNHAPELNTPVAREFRYLFCEALCWSPTVGALEIPHEALLSVAEKGRMYMLESLEKQRKKELSAAGFVGDLAALDVRAREEALAQIRGALTYWFGASEQSLDVWCAEQSLGAVPLDNEEEAEDESDGESNESFDD
jgi:hypothetical protein